ncbi:MAG TPA: hypothetical protein DIC42_02120 [Holosporales bacterium]|nr:hypothetical protein [Holosporales bacterium]
MNSKIKSVLTLLSLSISSLFSSDSLTVKDSSLTNLTDVVSPLNADTALDELREQQKKALTRALDSIKNHKLEHLHEL